MASQALRKGDTRQDVEGEKERAEVQVQNVEPEARTLSSTQGVGQEVTGGLLETKEAA